MSDERISDLGTRNVNKKQVVFASQQHLSIVSGSNPMLLCGTFIVNWNFSHDMIAICCQNTQKTLPGHKESARHGCWPEN